MIFKFHILEASKSLFSLVISIILYEADYLIGQIFGFSACKGTKHFQKLIK